MNKKGFTLIELLMVIAIIAIISMILIPNVINMISTNKQKSCESLQTESFDVSPASHLSECNPVRHIQYAD